VSSPGRRPDEPLLAGCISTGPVQLYVHAEFGQQLVARKISHSLLSTSFRFIHCGLLRAEASQRRNALGHALFRGVLGMDVWESASLTFEV
jgi:hypothetical protein